MLILISSLQMWKEDKLMIIMSTRKMTQEERVLDYMQRYGGITDKEARDKLGISRLGARIYNLKK